MLWGEQDGCDRGAKATLASDAVPASITLDGLQRKKKSTHSSDPGQGRARDGDGEVEPRRLHLSRKGALADGATRQRIDMDLGRGLGPFLGHDVGGDADTVSSQRRALGGPRRASEESEQAARVGCQRAVVVMMLPGVRERASEIWSAGHN